MGPAGQPAADRILAGQASIRTSRLASQLLAGLSHDRPRGLQEDSREDHSCGEVRPTRSGQPDEQAGARDREALDQIVTSADRRDVRIALAIPDEQDGGDGVGGGSEQPEPCDHLAFRRITSMNVESERTRLGNPPRFNPVAKCSSLVSQTGPIESPRQQIPRRANLDRSGQIGADDRHLRASQLQHDLTTGSAR